MKKGQTCNANFFNRWLNYKIEKLQKIERLCSAIMDALQIAEKPSWDGIRAKGTGNGDWRAGKKYCSDKSIYYGNIFDKLKRGENIAEYTDFRQWYKMTYGSGGAVERLFYKGGDLDKEGYYHPLWIPIPPYGENIDSFQTIRDDCRMLSQLLESVDAAHDEQDFMAIEDTVNGVIQGVFMLIGIHEQEHKITPKLKALAMREQTDRERRVKGGSVSSKNVAILEAVKEFIIEDRQRIGQTAATIARSFKRKYDSSTPIEVTVDSVKYEVYCDGKEVCSRSTTGEKAKYHDKSIAYSTFLARYISEAKSEAKPSISKKS